MDELRRLFAYNRWATQRVLAALDDLAPDELARDLASSFPTVLDTLGHAYGAEWVWLERWKSASPRAFPDPAALDSVASIRTLWKAVWQGQLDLLDGLAEGAEESEARYETFSGSAQAQPLSELVRHVVNHATYHRGQLATMLRQLGKTPPSTDYVRYLREEVG